MTHFIKKYIPAISSALLWGQKYIRHYKKSIYATILIGSTLYFGVFVYSATCFPPFDGTWNVEESCDFPVGYKIYGDINVGPHTLNVIGGTMGINLGGNKITFTTGKINFTNGKADNSVVNRYSQPQWYRTGVFTNCPQGVVLHPSMTRKMNWGERYNGVGGDGYIYCAK